MRSKDCASTVLSAFSPVKCLAMFNGNVTQIPLKYTSSALVPALPGEELPVGHKGYALLCITSLKEQIKRNVFLSAYTELQQ